MNRNRNISTKQRDLFLVEDRFKEDRRPYGDAEELDIFKEVLAPDEFLDYKGVYFKYGMKTSDYVNDYGVITTKHDEDKPYLHSKSIVNGP